MTGSPASPLLVQPFPASGQLVALAYRELDLAAAGSSVQIRALGDTRLLPRPWEPATCGTPQLRQQLWLWLDAVVEWLVAEYVWEAADTIPACWPQHPHLVHEIAVLADQRRRAGHAFTSDALEEWHRDSLPAFTERMKSRLITTARTATKPGRRKAAIPDTRPRSTDAPGRRTMRGTSVL